MPLQEDTLASSYLEHLHAYATWWRTTPPHDRVHHLHAELVTARARSIWYREHHLNASIPIPPDAPYTSRQMLQTHPGAFLGDTDILAQGGYEGCTSGSTGEPVTVWMCPWSLAHYYMHLEDAVALSPITLPPHPRQLFLSLFSNAHSFSETTPLWQGEITRADVSTLEEAFSLLHTQRPHILSLTPFELDLLLNAHKPFPDSLQLVVSTSARLSQQTIDHFYAQLHDRSVHLLNSYGCSEIGPIAFQCPASRNANAPWHVPPGSALLEAHHGFLAVTTLRNRAMPLTRYLVGDAVSGLSPYQTPAHCPECGHIGQSFEQLEGRALQIVFTTQNTPRTTVGWLRVLNDPAFQITRHTISQHRPGELLVSISGDPALCEPVQQALSHVDHDMHIVLKVNGARS